MTDNKAEKLSSEAVANEAVDDEVDAGVDDSCEVSNVGETANDCYRLE